MPTPLIRRSHERGRSRLAWLDSRHTFSFGDYHDPSWMGFRSLRVINDDVIAPGAGFPTHPHRDMEIISIVLDGALAHKDSLSSTGVIRPGDVQAMSAGSGIRHSEFNASGSAPVHLLQIWILPIAKGLEPRYEDRSFTFTPGHAIPVASGSASPRADARPLPINQDATVLVARVEPALGARHAIDISRHAWVHVATGSAIVNGEPLDMGDGIGLTGIEAVEIEGSALVVVFDLP